MQIQCIVWASAGYYDTGNELTPEVCGPFGFRDQAEAASKARELEKICTAHVESQAEIINESDHLEWDGPNVWFVATLELPTPVEGDPADPFAAIRAEVVRRDEQDGCTAEEFLEPCRLTVIGGDYDEFGPSKCDYDDKVFDELLDEIENG